MNVFLDAIYFTLRYIPWWAIPFGGICAYFSYVYWLKDLQTMSRGFAVISFICFLFLVYYIWHGSPDRTAKAFDDFLRSL